MTSPIIIEQPLAFYFSGSTATISLSNALQAGDVIQVGVDTNNGAAVTGVTAPGLTFELIGRGFSLSVWQAQASGPLSPPTMTLTYGSAYNTTTVIAALVRGATISAPTDPNPSLPAIQTGNPRPPDAVFSTTRAHDLLLLWIGCFVGFGGTQPWGDPVLYGNTIGPGAWNWVAGGNNTELLQPIALCLYAQTVSAQQLNVSVGSSAADLQGAAYLVTALTSDANAPPTPPPPPVALSAADLYFTSTGSFIDLSNEANRRRFISAEGGAQYLGGDGSGAFGQQPAVFLTVTGGGLSGTADTFAANNGYGGAFAETNGPLTLSVSSPPGSEQSAPAGQNIVGDYRNGNLYVFNLDQPLDAGTQRRWLRTFRATPQPSKTPRRFDCLTVDLETGAQVPQGTAPQIVARYSDDGGHTWSNAIIRPAGPPGATAQRVMFKRLGSTRRGQGLDSIFELSSSDRVQGRDHRRGDRPVMRIIEGDCRDVLPTLAVESFDCAIVDPPYGETSLLWDRRVVGWPALVRPLLKPSGSMWVFGSMRMFMECASEFDGWRMAQDIIWEKQNGTDLFNDRFRRVHEIAVHFYRDDAPWSGVFKSPQFTNDATARTVRKKGRPAQWIGATGETIYRSEDGGPRLQRSVLYARNEHSRALHPTQKPLDIVIPLLRYSCPLDGSVLDPMAGSGTVAVAAAQEGMRATLIEAKATYCGMAQGRLDADLLIRAAITPGKPREAPGYVEAAE